MKSDTSESGWQRFRGWVNRRQWRSAGNAYSVASPTAVENNDSALADRVAAWEDEGGSPAGSVSSVPAPPVDPTH